MANEAKLPVIYTYLGKNIEDLTEAECRQALRDVCAELSSARSMMESQSRMSAEINEARRVRALREAKGIVDEWFR
jgi:hypothetical protein